jgi:hydrogenase expression/formation protein HypE
MGEQLLATAGLACPAPHLLTDRVLLGHGSGGKMSAALLKEIFLPHLANPVLDALGDAAVVPLGESQIAISTDTFVVSPLEFPGGNIGSLAVHGTLNDIAMMGARPLYLTAGFVLEEGLVLEVLDRIVRTMAGAASAAQVPLVTGDTKVVERGKADGMFINTTGVGLVDSAFRPGPDQAQPGDVVLVSGALGRHGMAIMAAREGIAFESRIESDSASLVPLVELLRTRTGDVHVLRDPTRGGLASALNEIAVASNVGIELDESAIPVPAEVAAACDMLGLDPLYVANEGVLTAVVPAALREVALESLRSHPLGQSAACVGRVVREHSGFLVLRTSIGGTRIVDMLPGDQLPRIC